MAEGSKPMSQLKKFLDDYGWDYLLDAEQTLRGLFTGGTGQWHWTARYPEPGRFLLFASYCPLNVPQNRLAAAAEYLGLQFGNFKIDWTDGRVNFRTSIPVNSSGVAAKALEHLVVGNCALMDRYLPGLLAVTVGGADPTQAVQEAEGLLTISKEQSVTDQSNAGPAQVAPDGPTNGPEGPDQARRLREFFFGNN